PDAQRRRISLTNEADGNVPRMITRIAGLLTALLLAVPALSRPLTADDFYRYQEVSDPRISPDGQWVAYTVTTSKRDGDKNDQDLWLVSWNGREHIQLTNSDSDEHSPRWSPDGKLIAFLSDRGVGESG